MHVQGLAEKIAICAYCPFMCKDICTVYSQTKIDTLSPSMHEYLIWLILEGREKYSEEVADVLYRACCGCLLCQSWCATGQDVPEKVRAARMDLVELGLHPKPVERLNQASLRDHNPYGRSHAERFKELHRAIPEERWNGGADTLYFVGCATAYHQLGIARAVAAIMDRAGVELSVDDEEWCCGLPQFELGLLDTAKKLMEHNHQVIRGHGYKSVLTSCPECYYMLSRIYPSLGFDLKAEIHHVSSCFKRLMDESRLKLSGRLDGTVTYHDPCYLGRRCGIYEEPRRILKDASEKFVEMRWNRDKAYCGGGGVGYSILYPETAAMIGDKILIEAEKAGAGKVVTSCPTCKSQMEVNLKGRRIKVYDLSEVISQLL
ncbi:MAG: (Fe-S)-binding protein [Candidatus Bathyarchaeia archaeon]|nr:(Fe-S)-binding protein [Candidatus Bathyarchaeota archaeon]